MLLQKYEQAAESLIPDDKDLLRPTLWHHDLSPRNVFTSATGNPSLTDIIDWQGTEILPLYLHMQIPQFLVDEEQISQDSAERDPKLKEIRDYKSAREAWLHKVYALGTQAHSPLIYKALSFPHLILFSNVVSYAGQIGKGSIHPFRERLVQLYKSWEDVSPYPPPFSFTPDELVQHQQNYKEWLDGESGRRGLEKDMDIRCDGWVPTGEYEETKKRNEAMKKAFIKTAPPGYEQEYNRGWPFQSNSTFQTRIGKRSIDERNRDG